MWPFDPQSVPSRFGEGKIVPEADASFFSRLVFQWVHPFLTVGYARPLEKEDLWELPPSRLTKEMADSLERHFYLQSLRKAPGHPQPDNKDGRPAAEEPDTIKTSSEIQEADVEAAAAPPFNKKRWYQICRSEAPTVEGQRNTPSLLRALHRQFFYQWWLAGILRLTADVTNIISPVVTKILLTWLTNTYIYHRAPQAVPKPPGIGYGIGVGFGLFMMQEVASLLTNYSMYIAMGVGMGIRSSTISLIFRKSLRLSGKARLVHNAGQITTMISTDSIRLDRAAAMAHIAWITPIQIAIALGLLISNLGYSALVGLGVFFLGFPLQFVLVRIIFNQRKKGVVFTDARVSLTTEVLQGVRTIKLFAWEAFYMHKIADIRTKEIKAIKLMALSRSILIAVVTFLPTLASVLTFITYGLSGHDLSIPIIFSSLQIFNTLRNPLIYFPFVVSSLSEAVVALRRISKYLLAEELQEQPDIAYGLKYAIEADGDFTWETASPAGTTTSSDVIDKTAPAVHVGEKELSPSDSKGRGPFARRKRTEEASILPTGAKAEQENRQADATVPMSKEDRQPFELKSVVLKVPRGSFVAIVGPVGSGKSSILQALIGEMRKTKGHVLLGGSIAYVPQNAWIQNATIRQNILFGHADDEAKFRHIIRVCSLEHDLEMLPHGEETEIGEKGINLSGGQKARISLARAAYCPSDIVLLDDPLSAVDAYVGKAILDECILSGPLSTRTRVLVTHALHVLDKVDYIYVMDKGAIIEEGTFGTLMGDGVGFRRLMEEYGHGDKDDELRANRPGMLHDATGAKAPAGYDDTKLQSPLMQAEERNIGLVSWAIYARYLRFAGGVFWAPVILLFLTLTQGATVGNILFLGFWTSSSIPGFSQNNYMTVYACLGLAQGMTSFFVSFSFSLATLVASLGLFKAALNGVLRSPTSFFDATPLGRILSRLTGDQDTLDTQLSMTMFQFMYSATSILGVVALIFYTFPLLGIIFLPLATLYYVLSIFYRRTSVETKRLDSLLRSILFSSFSETLTGLSTVRAYGVQARAVRNAEHGQDMENRAYLATLFIQRWLAARLDLFGNILILGIVLFAAGFRTTVNPAKIGVVLSYTLSVTQLFSQLVTFFAQNEQNMNAVERVLVYTELVPEGDVVTSHDPPPTWPDKGEITFTDVQLVYREGLPLVLKNVSFQIKPGEKVGIVGRTGAGKTSLLQALFRSVNLQSGKIDIDGCNISEIGLDVLRGRLALVPQDAVLLPGPLRDNLDPQRSRTDAELLSALQRAWLLPRDGTPDKATEAKFSLDSIIGDEGSNYSAGEKQLLALCRALVKNSKIIVLDEATSNVDIETDARLQKTIQTEFVGSTLLCIAHRLNTIAYYDRILVMDRGCIAEFDTVLNLFDREGSIFRSLCDEAGLSKKDILKIRSEGIASNVTPV